MPHIYPLVWHLRRVSVTLAVSRTQEIPEQGEVHPPGGLRNGHNHRCAAGEGPSARHRSSLKLVRGGRSFVGTLFFFALDPVARVAPDVETSRATLLWVLGWNTRAPVDNQRGSPKHLVFRWPPPVRLLQGDMTRFNNVKTLTLEMFPMRKRCDM